MTNSIQTNQMVPCPVCQSPLSLRPAEGRKSGKPFLMLICPQNGRHFRGFISDRDFVTQVYARLKGQTPGVEVDGDLHAIPSTVRRSKTNLERASGS